MTGRSRKHPRPRQFRADKERKKIRGEWNMCKNHHELTGSNRMEVKQGGKTHTRCRECFNANQRAYQAKRRARARAERDAAKLAAEEAAAASRHCSCVAHGLGYSRIAELTRRLNELGVEVEEWPQS